MSRRPTLVTLPLLASLAFGCSLEDRDRRSGDQLTEPTPDPLSLDCAAPLDPAVMNLLGPCFPTSTKHRQFEITIATTDGYVPTGEISLRMLATQHADYESRYPPSPTNLRGDGYPNDTRMEHELLAEERPVLRGAASMTKTIQPLPNFQPSVPLVSYVFYYEVKDANVEFVRWEAPGGDCNPAYCYMPASFLGAQASGTAIQIKALFKKKPVFMFEVSDAGIINQAGGVSQAFAHGNYKRELYIYHSSRSAEKKQEVGRYSDSNWQMSDSRSEYQAMPVLAAGGFDRVRVVVDVIDEYYAGTLAIPENRPYIERMVVKTSSGQTFPCGAGDVFGRVQCDFEYKSLNGDVAIGIKVGCPPQHDFFMGKCTFNRLGLPPFGVVIYKTVAPADAPPEVKNWSPINASQSFSFGTTGRVRLHILRATSGPNKPLFDVEDPLYFKVRRSGVLNTTVDPSMFFTTEGVKKLSTPYGEEPDPLGLEDLGLGGESTPYSAVGSIDNN